MNAPKAGRNDKKNKRKETMRNRSDSSSNSSQADEQYTRNFNVMDTHRMSVVAMEKKEKSLHNKLMAKFDNEFHHSTLHKENFDD